MITSRTSRLLATATAALSFSACDFSYACGVVSRTVASGTVRDAAGVTLGTAQAEVSEHLRPSFLRLHAGVEGPSGAAGAPLRGHVTRARLVTESGELLAEIPTGTGTLFSESVVALNVDVSSQEYDRVRGALLTMRARIILDTDLPGREHIETVLQDVTEPPQTVGRCRPA
jgi:hypothetical protein